jgi:uncharacterized protein (DUF1697 family)
MERFAAFLRGMNLGGRRVKNEELRRLVAGLGFEGAASFRGNLIFESEERRPERVAEALEAGLADALGYEVPVFLRAAGELLSIAAQEPFTPDQLAASRGKHQVILLRERPRAAARRGALAQGTEDDRLALEGRELHWLPSGGISESELDLRALESALGPTTIRTKGTIDQIAARHFAS